MTRPTRETPYAEKRRRQLALIHAAKKKLGLDDDTYRDIVVRVSAEHGEKQRSAANLSAAQLDALEREMRRLSGTSRSFDVDADKPKNLSERPLLRKIGALLAQGRKPWNYGHELGKRLGGADRLEFCRDDVLRKAVAALDADARRHSGRASYER